jgi:hypothetical protein
MIGIEPFDNISNKMLRFGCGLVVILIKKSGVFSQYFCAGEVMFMLLSSMVENQIDLTLFHVFAVGAI